MPLAVFACSSGDDGTSSGGASTGTGAGAGAGAGGTSTTGSAAGGGAATGTSSGGGGASASTGTAGGGGTSSSTGTTSCTPGEVAPCYEGPVATEGVGDCKAGTHVCGADGMSFGACTGQVLPASDDCMTAADEDCDGSNAVCSGGVYWSRAYGDVDPQQSAPSHHHSLAGIAVDASGNAYLAGSYQSTMSFGAAGQLALTAGANTDAYLAKIGSDGAPVWAKHFGGPGGVVFPQSIAIDPQGHLVVVGYFRGTVSFGGPTFTAGGSDFDMFVASFDGSGALRFSKAFGGTGYFIPHAVACGDAGQIAITGDFDHAVTFGGNQLNPLGQDFFVVELDTNGDHLWSRRFGDASAQGGTDIAVKSTGNVVVVGYSGGTIDFGGGPLASTGFGVALAELSGATGAHVWSKVFDNAVFDEGDRQLALDANDDIVLGTYGKAAKQTQIDFGGGPLTGYFFVVKLSPTGTYQWGKAYAGLRGVSALSTDATGAVVFTGQLQQTIDFGTGPITPFDGNDGYIAKLDAAGNGVWARAVSDSDQSANQQYGTAVATDASGNVLAGGTFAGAVNFGDGEKLAENGFSSGPDVYLVKLAP
jgi:hypothetical protein